MYFLRVLPDAPPPPEPFLECSSASDGIWIAPIRGDPCGDDPSEDDGEEEMDGGLDRRSFFTLAGRLAAGFPPIIARSVFCVR